MNACNNVSQKEHSIITPTIPTDEATKFGKIEGILSACSRLTERTWFNFQNPGNGHSFFTYLFFPNALGSKTGDRWFIKNRLNRVSSCPLYVCYRNLSI